eukprot:COSAG06_NODE_10904_length_1598_cov_80.741828_2_plen_169_part_00
MERRRSMREQGMRRRRTRLASLRSGAALRALTAPQPDHPDALRPHGAPLRRSVRGTGTRKGWTEGGRDVLQHDTQRRPTHALGCQNTHSHAHDVETHTRTHGYARRYGETCGDRQTDTERERQADAAVLVHTPRETQAHARTHARTHAHTHTQRERERATDAAVPSRR